MCNHGLRRRWANGTWGKVALSWGKHPLGCSKFVKSPSTKVREMTWVWSIGEVCQGTTTRGNDMISRMLQQWKQQRDNNDLVKSMNWTRLHKGVEFKNYIHEVTPLCSICSVSQTQLSTLSTCFLLNLLNLNSTTEHPEHLLVPQVRSFGVFPGTPWRGRNTRFLKCGWK